MYVVVAVSYQLLNLVFSGGTLAVVMFYVLKRTELHLCMEAYAYKAFKKDVLCLENHAACLTCLQEVDILKSVSYDRNVVQFYGTCLWGDKTMLVLEYMEVCCQGKRVPLHNALLHLFITSTLPKLYMYGTLLFSLAYLMCNISRLFICCFFTAHTNVAATAGW